MRISEAGFGRGIMFKSLLLQKSPACENNSQRVAEGQGSEEAL